MTNSCQLSDRPAPSAAVGTTSIAVRLLDALAARDFVRLADCFEPTATMRALLPRGLAEYDDAHAIVEAFRFWFGSADEFAVTECAVDQVGDQTNVSWRIRLDKSPRAAGWHVLEQQSYLRGSDHIESVNLLCTGFMVEEAGGR